MKTKLIRSLYNIEPEMRGGIVTIGNFDGVHRGHQQLLKKITTQAKQLQVPSIVMTFEPHPFEFFSQDQLTIPRITRLREKFLALQACGVDYVLVVKFNQSFASISASDFAEHIIAEQLAPLHMVIGDDFRFGYKRQGDYQQLADVGLRYGFSVSNIESVLHDGKRISSTWVREALQKGDLALAEVLLGRPYSMLGRIQHGDKLGRQLGFPTANIHLHRRLTPVNGVFAVTIEGLGAEPLPGAANVGTRPTVDGTRTLLEVHLLDFNQDIYGRYVQVTFCHKLRDEIYYPNLTLLQQQIASDVVATKDYFDHRN